MTRFILLLLTIALSTTTYGQKKVPSRMEFAGIKLRIMDDAREEIQKDVDALTASPKYFEIKAERARTYFPIIERIFREENLPDDFKYLVLQESALISDAVSSSNAVGFWQFKDFTAIENGMIINREIDERKNIISSTKGAASYLKKNNRFFDNWLHTLQSYQQGAGGAMKSLSKGHEGAKTMVVNKKTYWYVKKYLAHKVAFEGSTDQRGQVTISEYYDGNGKSLREIARKTGADEEELKKYNKWALKSRVPDDDRKYAVIIPSSSGVVLPAAKPAMVTTTTKPLSSKVIEYTFDKKGEFPKIKDEELANSGGITKINGLPGIIAQAGNRITGLAQKGDISLSRFLKYNDLGIDGKIIPGQVYYFKNKRNRAQAYYHVAQFGETLWSISQKFGIKLKKLRTKNRIRDEGLKIKPGRVLWLRYMRPANVDIEYKQVSVPSVEKPEIVKDTTNLKDDEPIKKDDGKIKLENEQIVQLNEPVSVDTTEVIADNGIEMDEQEIPDDLQGEVEMNVEIDKIKKIHTVELGQTFYAISKIYDVAVLDIAYWNNLSISTPLNIGQKLVVYLDGEKDEIDPTEPADVKSFVHEVDEGETLYQISNRYGVRIEDIMKWNNKSDNSVSYGEKLKIERIQK